MSLAVYWNFLCWHILLFHFWYNSLKVLLTIQYIAVQFFIPIHLWKFVPDLVPISSIVVKSNFARYSNHLRKKSIQLKSGYDLKCRIYLILELHLPVDGHYWFNDVMFSSRHSDVLSTEIIFIFILSMNLFASSASAPALLSQLIAG